MPDEDVKPQTGKSAAATVAAGIFASRLIGFLRESSIAYFFGVSAFADVLRVSFRGPNVLQNLLGEGTLSAAFIPIYSRMIEEGREQEAGRFAGAIFGLLLASVCVFVLAGILLAEPLVFLLSAGFVNDAEKVAAGELAVNRFDLSVDAVRIVFPMTGILVLSAWALGVLNSHRRFFLPYFAPVLSSVAIIAALFVTAYWFVGEPVAALRPEALSADALTDLLFAAFFGALVGAILQFVVQLPLVFRLLKGFRPSLSRRVQGVREALGAFGPVVAGRGVYQISGYLDLFLASFLAAGALAALGYAQILYMLPVSLFGVSVAASELPELSRLGDQQTETFILRINRSVRQMLFMTIPTLIGYLAFGFLIVSALFRRGGFDRNDAWLVYAVLAAYTLGLLATTISRLVQNAFYALGDTRTPAKIAVQRVVVSTAVAVPLMFWLDRFTVSGIVDLSVEAGEILRFGAVGLAFGASVGGWVELWRLRRALRQRVTGFDLPWSSVAKMSGLACLAVIPAAALWWILPDWDVVIATVLVVGVFGVTYLAAAHLTGAPEMEAWAGRFLRRFSRS